MFTNHIKYPTANNDLMKIDTEKCIGCGNCVYYCPVGAIYVKTEERRRIAVINEDDCVECGLCLRMMNLDVTLPALKKESCPTSAFYQDRLTYPRILRKVFSDPTGVKEETGVSGRGTEEVKTVNVTHRVVGNEVGFNVELGRPGTGTRFSEIEKMTKAISEIGVEFEPNNPLTSLMTNPKEGTFRDEIRNEKALSAIIEFKTSLDYVPRVLEAISSATVNTVFVVGIYSLCDSKGMPLFEKYVNSAGFKVSLNGKTNLGVTAVSEGAVL